MDECSGVRGQSERSVRYCSRDRSCGRDDLTRRSLGLRVLTPEFPTFGLGAPVFIFAHRCSRSSLCVLRTEPLHGTPGAGGRPRHLRPTSCSSVACFISLRWRAWKTVIEECTPFAPIDLHLKHHRSPESCQMATCPACSSALGVSSPLVGCSVLDSWLLARGLRHHLRRAARS